VRGRDHKHVTLAQMVDGAAQSRPVRLRAAPILNRRPTDGAIATLPALANAAKHTTTLLTRPEYKAMTMIGEGAG
jgi:hypothetical protein